MTLDKWMHLTGTNDAAAAALFGRDRSHVSKLRRGLTLPSYELMIVIRDATDGAVSLESWSPVRGVARPRKAEARA